MIALIKRNLKVFFREKSSVFFSLLSALIILGLYIFFLGDIQSESLGIESPRYFMDLWMISGIMGVISVSSTLGALGVMVTDRSEGIYKDFKVSPLKRSMLVYAYILSAVLIGVLMSLVTLLVSQIYIYSSGHEIISWVQLLKVLGILVLAVSSSASIVFFIVSFIHSQSTYTTVSILVGTLVGFLAGIYVPIGQLPNTVQSVVKAFPVSHAALLFKQVMMGDVLQTIPEGMLPSITTFLGITFEVGGNTLTFSHSVLYLCITILMFGGMSILNMNRKL